MRKQAFTEEQGQKETGKKTGSFLEWPPAQVTCEVRTVIHKKNIPLLCLDFSTSVNFTMTVLQCKQILVAHLRKKTPQL